MVSRNLPRSVRERRVVLRSFTRKLSLNDRWLLSFGDMLTLVLCFFICLLVTVDGTNRKQRLKTIGDAPSQRVVANETEVEETRGTGTFFAHQVLERDESLILFGADSFQKESFDLSVQVSQKLKEVLNSMDWKVESARLGVCEGSKTGQPVAHSVLEVSRLLAIRSQLLDTAVGSARLAFDFQPERCEESHEGVIRMGGALSQLYLRMTPATSSMDAVREE